MRDPRPENVGSTLRALEQKFGGRFGRIRLGEFT